MDSKNLLHSPSLGVWCVFCHADKENEKELCNTSVLVVLAYDRYKHCHCG